MSVTVEAESCNTSERVETRKAGKPSFAELYADSYPRVYNYVFFRLLNKAETEDVVAETFMRAYSAFDRFDPSRASFTTWVFAIAHNCLVSFYRSRRASSPIEDLPEGMFSEEDDYPNLDDTAKQVRGLLECLGDEERQLVFLKYYEEMHNSDIAEMLNINASTVSTKLARALQKMRAHAER